MSNVSSDQPILDPISGGSPDISKHGKDLSAAVYLAPKHDFLSVSERLAMGCLALGLFSLLALAMWLEPSPSGIGTHQQLGLPPCTLQWLVGIRCPGCGMTTSWACLMDGRIGDGFRANSGGAMLCLIAIVFAPFCAWFAYLGQPSQGGWFSRYALICLLLALGVALLEWVLRLAF